MEKTEIRDSKKTDLMLVDPRNIIIDEDFNVRKDYGDMDELTKSIMENGMIEPIICAKVRKEDKYMLTDGFRRMRAVMAAIEKGCEIPFVKVIIASGTMEDRILQMVITGTGKKPLTVLEEAEAYKRLVAHSFEAKEIASKTGKSVAHVYNMLKLADAPMKVKKMIEKNEITATTVMQLIRNVKTTDELLEVIENAANEANTGVTDGKVKKVTTKNVATLKSPMQKLKEAYEICESEKLAELIAALASKTSTGKSIAKLFS